jgi:hypothetical protein
LTATAAANALREPTEDAVVTGTVGAGSAIVAL